jgi:RNA polymerase sigma-70 factor (ECF subfamily)
VAALNRAIALANVHGPAAGIEAVNAIQRREKLQSYHLLYAVLGEFEMRLGNSSAAIPHLQTALSLTHTESERAFLEKRLLACTAVGSSDAAVSPPPVSYR